MGKMETCMPRLKRPESQALTRERLIDAARRIFLSEGYVRVSVDKIAEEAGYSKGAVYSNFAGKEALFLELLKQKFETELSGLGYLMQTVTDPSELLALLRQYYERKFDEPDITLVAVEFLTQVGRGSSYREECNLLYAEQRRAMAEMIAVFFDRSGRVPPSPPVELATALMGLSMGLAVQRGADPTAVTASTWGMAIEQNLRGLLALGAEAAKRG